MSIFEKHRFEIWNPTQHPYKHTLGDFGYSNPSVPGITTLEGALNWLFAIMYPNTKESVADVASLPAAGNTINDYRVVLDDGDGKAAAYRWEQREGDVAAKWYKVYDMDWGETSILSNFLIKTQDVYVFRYGYDDTDSTGAVITGTYAGQTIYGGASANTHLTLRANSGDGLGADTGFVQFDDQVRPAVTNTFDLGTATEEFKDIHLAGTANVSTMAITGGSITDSSGTISFGDEILTTTGNISGTTVTGTTSLVASTMTLATGSITDSSGAISFGDENLSTTGTLASGTITVSSDLSLATGSITSVSGAISFGNENLSTTGTLSAGNTDVTLLDVDNIRLDANTISITNVGGNLNLAANGAGVIDLQSAMTTLGQTVTGTMGITGQLDVDNLTLNGNTVSSTNLDGNIILAPNGAGLVETGSGIFPTTTSVEDLGKTGNVWNDLWIDGNIQDGTNALSVATMMSFRDALVGAATGHTLFYNSVSGKWESSLPDSEVDHTTIANLTTGDAGHTQFALLAGRSGGQTIQGGTAASENLVLESTSNVTKGTVQTKDNLVPQTNASYSGGWSGTDLGDATHYYKDLYTKGELKGGRVENFTSGTLPAASGQNIGRLVFETDTNKLKIDTGASFITAGSSKYQSDLAFNGTDTTKDVDVSSSITDARTAIIQLLDNTNDYERIYTTIKATSASNVRIDTGAFALPAGSYRLIVIE